MNRKLKPTVIIVNTGLAAEESSKAFYDVLSDKVAHIHKDPDLDWKSALAYHDIEKSGIDADFIEETEVILHKIMGYMITAHPYSNPEKGLPNSAFTLEQTDNYGFEVGEQIKEKNNALAPIRKAMKRIIIHI